MSNNQLLAILINGKKLVCTCCSGKQFNYDKLILSGAGILTSPSDYKTVHTYSCHKCGNLQFFNKIQEFEAVLEELECLSCGEIMPETSARCVKCGWSYEDK